MPGSQSATSTSSNPRSAGGPVRARSRFISLVWAAPFMIFMVHPVVNALRLGLGTSLGALLLIETIALALAYVLTWVRHDPAPLNDSQGRSLLVSISVLLVLVGAMVATSRAAGVFGSFSMTCYLMPPVALLTPRRWLLPALSGALGLTAVGPIFLAGEGFAPLIVSTPTLIVCLASRMSLDRQQVKEIQNQQEFALAQERERSRISADLHDILGQTLTGITVKADLAGRLFDAGHAEEARTQLDELTEMSRTALSDIREVVAANRTLLPETEIDSAQAIFDAAGIRLEVVGQAADGSEALTILAELARQPASSKRESTPVDVVLMDIEMAGLDGITACRKVCECFPGVRVLMLTTFGRPGYLQRSLDAGASGFMVKDAPSGQLAAAVRKVARGERVLDPTLAMEALIKGASPLAERETEVLRAVAGGGTIADIARDLKLSQGTTRNHVSTVMTKIGARTRAEAVRIATESGWL